MDRESNTEWDVIAGEKADSKIDDFWIETGRNAISDSIANQIDAAKQLISITSILQAIYFAAISFSDLKKELFSYQTNMGGTYLLILIFVSPIIFWLLSLAFSVRVLVPLSRGAMIDSPTGIRSMVQEAIYFKSKYLRAAHLMLIFGFIPLIISIAIYLSLGVFNPALP